MAYRVRKNWPCRSAHVARSDSRPVPNIACDMPRGSMTIRYCSTGHAIAHAQRGRTQYLLRI
eukprot:2853675-Rhodomonas_salina.5